MGHYGRQILYDFPCEAVRVEFYRQPDSGGEKMLGQVHDHIVSELRESSRTDTIFVLTAIVFNLIVLGIKLRRGDGGGE